MQLIKIEKIIRKSFIVANSIIIFICICFDVQAQINEISYLELLVNNTDTLHKKQLNFNSSNSVYKSKLAPLINTETLTSVSNPVSLINHSSHIKKITSEEYSIYNAFMNRNYLSGDWWGIRNDLSESGFDFDFVYTGELFSNVYGGISRGTTTLDNIDIIFSSDLEKSFGWENTNLLLYFLGNNGGSPTDLVGASQGVSNIETLPTWKLYQLHLEKIFFDKQLSIVIGLYDLNSEFDTRETSGIFINPSHGIGDEIGKSGLNGPSIFPTTSASVRFKYKFNNGKYFQTAILDGVPGDLHNPNGTHIIFNRNDGLLLITEFGLDVKVDEELNYKIALGVWGYTKELKKNNFMENGTNIISLEKNYGFYLSAEKKLSSIFDNHYKSLYGFMRIGYANKDINPVDFYFGTGIKIKGLFNGRYDDEFGIALALSHNSFVHRNTISIMEKIDIKPFELNLELTYSLQLTPWLIIQPDIQYIINPSYSNQYQSAFIVDSRIQLIF